LSDNEYLIEDEIPKKSFITEEKIIDHLVIIKDFDYEYCKAIIEHCANGGSVESFAGKEYIDPDTLVAWANDEELYSDFRSAVKIAIAAEYNYWERELLTALKDQENQFKLPSINRKLAELGSTLLKNGLRRSMYGNFNTDSVSEEDKTTNQNVNNFVKV